MSTRQSLRSPAERWELLCFAALAVAHAPQSPTALKVLGRELGRVGDLGANGVFAGLRGLARRWRRLGDDERIDQCARLTRLAKECQAQLKAGVDPAAVAIRQRADIDG